MWHDVQGLGILYLSVIAGVMNANVWARTYTPGITLDFRHVAGHALAARAALFVMGVLFQGSGAGAVP